MNTTDKVQVGNSTTGTTTTSQWQTCNHYNAEKGWECPRCGRINAPWVRQCDCSPSTSTWDKITVNPCNEWDKITINTHGDEWWKNQITCDDTFKIHPESTDYKDSVTGSWVNVPKTYTNSIKR